MYHVNIHLKIKKICNHDDRINENRKRYQQIWQKLIIIKLTKLTIRISKNRKRISKNSKIIKLGIS